MDYSKYYEARAIVAEIIKKDLLGPLEEEEVLCDERPLEYYICGKLYPQQSHADIQVKSTADDYFEIDDDADSCISLSNSYYPSSMGISFTLLPHAGSLRCKINAAYYIPLSYSEADELLHFTEDHKYSEKTVFWKRVPLEYIFDQNISVLKVKRKLTVKVHENLVFNIFLHKIYDDGTKTITASLVNNGVVSSDDYSETNRLAFFQPRIEISSTDGSAIFADVRRNISLRPDHETTELNMLYSKVHNYASGHGCAVNWLTDGTGKVESVFTDFLPEHQVLQMKPSSKFKHSILSMKYLAESDQKSIISGLSELTRMYADWIKIQNESVGDLSSLYQDDAKANLKKCQDTLERLEMATKLLNNDDVFRAFKLANKAMFVQRKNTLQNNGQFQNDEDIKWYPFQLAFFLQEVISFAQPESDERKMADLLWFPTGGGKTEAYLGIAAFVIFLRRIRHGENGSGVTVLMRYTLRLLSFQQFERAAALIFACELIRHKEKIGGGEISVGLWAGRTLTPNKINMAARILSGGKDPDAPTSNPAQIKKCPWCGETITHSDYHCNKSAGRMLIKCPNVDCYFSEGMPLYLVDEEIYKYTPTFIIATVDKFAQLALNENTGVLLGKGNGKIPPELIIQDELHLISGPLGTITGLYEAAIKKLCEYRGISPKVVASTATIRNAEAQIKALYGTTHTQFPPQGIDIEDSFFAEIANPDDKPARLYLGCMAVGTSSTTMMIRVMAALLFATRYLTGKGYDDRIVDSLWTITGYFNSLRELGGALIRVLDDIQDRFSYLKQTKFVKHYPGEKLRDRYDYYKELTSRESGENIGNVLQEELKIAYSSTMETTPYDFLMASNMISVGIDVGRLGTMVVVGQPKSTAEYIQATSRVGRETPGLVITTYNQAKSRDRSHYEQFTQYHSAYYKFVEATSLTPFSDRARDRALQALYIILCRHNIDSLRQNEDAANFSMSIRELDDIDRYILSYVNTVDPEECENVKNELNQIKLEWDMRAGRDLKYYEWFKSGNHLFEPDYKEGSRFRILNTMRSVETKVTIYSED